MVCTAHCTYTHARWPGAGVWSPQPPARPEPERRDRNVVAACACKRTRGSSSFFFPVTGSRRVGDFSAFSVSNTNSPGGELIKVCRVLLSSNIQIRNTDFKYRHVPVQSTCPISHLSTIVELGVSRRGCREETPMAMEIPMRGGNPFAFIAPGVMPFRAPCQPREVMLGQHTPPPKFVGTPSPTFMGGTGPILPAPSAPGSPNENMFTKAANMPPSPLIGLEAIVRAAAMIKAEAPESDDAAHLSPTTVAATSVLQAAARLTAAPAGKNHRDHTGSGRAHYRQ